MAARLPEALGGVRREGADGGWIDSGRSRSVGALNGADHRGGRDLGRIAVVDGAQLGRAQRLVDRRRGPAEVRRLAEVDRHALRAVELQARDVRRVRVVVVVVHVLLVREVPQVGARREVA